jgi:transposase
MSAYRFVDGKLVEVNSQEEIIEVENALKNSDKFVSVKNALTNSIKSNVRKKRTRLQKFNKGVNISSRIFGKNYYK